MSTSELRKVIKKAVDKVPPERLESLADYVQYLSRPSLDNRIRDAEQAIEEGKGRNWRAVRSDV
jgi:hypothetical protein